ncbi:MAG: S8 family serine peptidase, partial [Muribaculaceae bacterium]|nr:S8 family serine peptidase [Muribaculaceae bacterium]
MAVVSVTAQQMEQLAALPQVKQVSLGFEKNASMYVARPVCGVDVVQEGGDDLGKKYTGKGVVAGLFDTGMDANHINFLDADGVSRVKGIWAYASNGKLTAYTTQTQIKNFTTENNGETHGTHVLGIMGGGYAGPAKYAIIGGVNGRQVVLTEQDAADSSIPFYGVATDADLAIGCGTLTDGNISAGVQKIVEYAEANGQPCVVNLSVGSNIGPHDGTDAITKYLAQLGERAIICIAAGNEGDDNISISASKGKTIQTFVEATSTSTGTIQFWGSDDQPFTIRFIGYDRSKGKEVFSYTLDKNLEGKSVRQSDMTGFNTALKGTITLSSNVNTANNRYNVTASMNVSGISTTIFPGFVIEPLENQTVDGYANQMVFLSYSVPGFTNGNANNSISSMACGENVIVVGSFTTAAQWAAFDTKGGATIYSYNPRPTVGAISSFSSYGKTFAGKQLPDVCAPGEGIISSFSQYYVNKAPSSATQGWLMGEYTAPKSLLSRNSPWGLMQGTSMACPYVAGVIASWLEADPTLTVAQVTDIIYKTAKTDAYTATKKARFGAGKIDALAGIKEVLS